jgi:hypothetical protein
MKESPEKERIYKYCKITENFKANLEENICTLYKVFCKFLTITRNTVSIQDITKFSWLNEKLLENYGLHAKENNLVMLTLYTMITAKT